MKSTSYTHQVWLYLLLSDRWQGDRNRLSVVHSRTAYDQTDSVPALFQDLSDLLAAQTVQICITDPKDVIPAA